MALNLGDIIVRLGLDTGQFSREMRAAQRQLQGAASGFKTAGRAATMAFTAPLVAAGAIAVKFAADFDAAMTQSMAIMTEFGARSELTAEGQESLRGEMEATARTVAKDLNLAASDAAKSFFFLTSAGMDAQQSMAALPQVAAFAKAGMFDFATATDLATDAQSALGLKSDDVAENLANLTRVTDVLVAANQLANASTEQFALALTTKAGAALKVANKSIEEGVAVLAVFADQGVKAQNAGTALQIVLRDLSTKALKNKEAFDSLGIAVFDQNGNYNNMADIIGDLEGALEGMSDAQTKATLLQLGFTDKSVIYLQTLLGTSEAMREHQSRLESMGGATKEVAENQLKAFNEQLGLVQKRVVDAAISVGTKLMPVILDLLDGLEPLVDLLVDAAEWFATLPKPVQMAALAVAGMVAAIGPLLMAFGFIAEGAASLIAIWPAIASGVTLLEGALVLLSAAAGYFAGSVLVEWADNLFGASDATQDATREVGFFQAAIVILGDVVGVIVNFFDIWLGAVNAVASVFGGFGVVAEVLGEKLKQAFWPQLAVIKLIQEAIEFTAGIFFRFANALESGALKFGLFGKAAGESREAVFENNQAFQEFVAQQNAALAASREMSKALEDTAAAAEHGQDALDMFADTMGISRTKLDLVAKRLGLTTKKLFDNAKASGMVTKELDKMAKEAADAEKRLRDMVRTVGDATREAEDLARAVELEGGAMALTKEETKRLAAMIKVWEGNNIEVADSLEDVVDRAEALKQVENVLNTEMEITSVRGDKVVSTLEEMTEAHRKKLEQLKLDNEAMETYNADLEAQAAATEVAGITAEEFTGALGTVGDVAWELAGIFDGAFGRIANSMGLAVDAGRRLKKSLEGADWAGAAGSLVEGAMALAQATEGGGAGGIAGGAVTGAVMGAQLGGAYGAAIGGAIGALVGWLREDVGKAITSVLGVTVSEGLEKSIKQTKDMFKDFEDLSGRAGAEGIGTMGAALLHLGNAMRELGGAAAFGMDASQLALTKLIDRVAEGRLPMEQGLAAIGDAFTQFAAAATEGGAVASEGLFQIMEQAKRVGLEIPEIAAFIKEQLSLAMEGVGAIIGQALGEGEGFGGIQIVTAQDAQDQATIFSATFFAAVEEMGLRDAVEALGPAFDAMKEKMSAFGEVDLGGIEKFFEIARDPQFGPLLDGVQGLADSVAGLANSGYLTVDVFNALQRQGLEAFDQLIAAGLTSNEALQQMGPYLQNAIDASNQLGIPLDANTAKLIEQAEAAGVAFKTDPMYVMIDAIKILAEVMGATAEQIESIGASAAGAAGGVEELGSATTEVGNEIEQAIAEATNTIEDEFTEMQRIGDDRMLHLSDSVEGVAGKFEPLIEAAKTAAKEIGDIPTRVDVEIFEKFHRESDNVEPMQHGALVTKPTLALIGEAGPELVIPVGDLNRVTNNAGNLAGDGDQERGDAPLANYLTIVLEGQVVGKYIVETVARAHRLGDIDFTEQLVDPRA